MAETSYSYIKSNNSTPHIFHAQNAAPYPEVVNLATHTHLLPSPTRVLEMITATLVTSNKRKKAEDWTSTLDYNKLQERVHKIAPTISSTYKFFTCG